jgi:hypothetical protein
MELLEGVPLDGCDDDDVASTFSRDAQVPAELRPDT